MASVPLALTLTVRDLTLDDVADLDWSGSSSHLTHVVEHVVAAEQGTCRVLGVVAPNGLIIAKGGVLFELPESFGDRDAGLLWMLAVRESWQSVGVGTVLVGALEQAARDRGRAYAVLGVEHDNPRAAALYRRLGYATSGSTLDGWSIGHRTQYVTVSTLMEKPLTPAH